MTRPAICTLLLGILLLTACASNGATTQPAAGNNPKNPPAIAHGGY